MKLTDSKSCFVAGRRRMNILSTELKDNFQPSRASVISLCECSCTDVWIFHLYVYGGSMGKTKILKCTASCKEKTLTVCELQTRLVMF